MTSITIPNSVTTIENYIFQNCSSLTSITIPNSVKSICDYAFSSCSGLTSITIPNSVTSIGSRAFEGCSSLTSVVIGNSVTSIGEYAFAGCDELQYIMVPVTDYADFCNNKTVGAIRNSVRKPVQLIDNEGNEIKEYIIPNSVTSIGNNAFYNVSLKTLIIGTGVLSIGNNSFNYRPIKTIWLTNTPPQGYRNAQGQVNYVANNLYSELENMKEYKFLSSMFDVDGMKYVPVSPSDRTCDAIDYIYDESVNDVNIKSTVSYKGVEMAVLNLMPYLFYDNKYLQSVNCDVAGNVGGYAFYNCENLQAATLGENITGIDGYAFSGCTKLDGIVMHDSVKSIGYSAFSGCSGMKSVRIGNSTRSIMNGAFHNCSVLPRITIPGSVTYLGDYIFRGCNSLKEVVMSDRKKGANTILFDDWYISSNETKTIVVNTGDTLSFDYQVTNGRLNISSDSYSNSYSGSGTYKRGFSNPQTITIYFRPDNSSTSYSCSITNMKLIESGLLSLGSNDYYPLFADCPLDSVYIGRNISYDKNSNKGYSPFYRNTSLRSVVITDKEEEISENEFYGCTNLQNVQIGDGVTTIGNWAFSGCASLQNFAFGTQVQTIGKEAFSDCTAVTAIISKAQTPPVCDSQALDDINKWSCMLYVPKGCKDSYAAADQWKDFFFVEEGEGGGTTPEDPSATKCAKPTISYKNGKLMFDSATPGVEYVYEIADSDIKKGNSSEVNLTATYHITVYATKNGLENSDVATATLCWIDVEPQTEGIENSVVEVRALAVLIKSNGGQLSIEGINDGECISVYTIDGVQIGSAISKNGEAIIDTGLKAGTVAIVKIGSKSIKKVIK